MNSQLSTYSLRIERVLLKCSWKKKNKTLGVYSEIMIHDSLQESKEN